MPIVDIEGIGPIDFPEGVTREQAADIIRRAAAAKAQPEPPSRQPLSLPQQAGATLAGIGRGFWGAPVSALEGLGGVTGSETLLNAAKGIRESDLGKMLLEVPENYRDRAASTAGEVVGNLGAMFVPGAALKGAGAARVATGAMSGLQGASEQVRRAEENRRNGMQVSPDDVTAASRLGSMTGLLDLIPYGRMAGTIAPKGMKLAEEAAARSVIGRALGTGAIEGGTEAGQQLLQNLIEGRYNPNQAATEGIGDSAVAGGAAGFGLDALLGMIGKHTGKKIVSRRDAVRSLPIEATDVDSVGIRRGEGGDPLIELLRRAQSEQPSTRMNLPRENYRKPPKAAPELTAKEKQALATAQLQQKLQRTMPDISAPIDTASMPREDYRAPGEEPVPLTRDEIMQRRMQELIPDVTPQQMELPRENYRGPATEAPPVPYDERMRKMVPEATLPASPMQLPKESYRPMADPPSYDERMQQMVVPQPAKRMQMPKESYRPVAIQPEQPPLTAFPKERYSLDDASTPAPTPYTVEALGQEIQSGQKPQIALDIFAEMKNLGVDDLISTRLIDGLTTKAGDKSQGTYGGRIIQLALKGKSKQDLLRTLNHESVHAMKQMGLFNDAEWNLLNATFNPNTALTDQEREQYSKLYGGDTAKLNEEAVARGIERYAAGQINATPEAVSIASKAVSAVDRLGSALRGNGFQNTNDVLRSFRSGDIGSRPANLPPPPAAARTLAQYEKGQYDTPIKNGKAAKQVVRPTQNVSSGKRSTALADIIDQGEAAEDIQHSIVPQLPVAGSTPFGAPDERTSLKKAIDAFVKKDGLGGIGLKVRQNVLDMRAGISELGRRAGDTTARTGSEAAVRNADVSQDFASSALKNGALEYVGNSGDGYFRSNGDTVNAPATVFKEAYQNGKLNQLFHYLAAERADVLRSEGREKKISAEDAAAWKEYGRDPEIAGYAERWKTFNNQMVDTLQKSGRIDAETAKKFKANTYLPFYRIEEGADGQVDFQSSGSNLASSPRLEKLKGSELDIGDPTDNIVRNVNTLTAMAMKNEAMQRVARDGMQTGFIKQVPQPVAGKPNMKVWVNGKEKHFEVLDPILYESVAASRIPSSTVMTIAGMPARLLREGVTLDPVFAVNNVLRDSTAAWLHGFTDVPMQDVVQSAYRAITNKPSFQRLEKAGVIGNSIRGEGGAAGTGKTLREHYTGKTGLLHKLEDFSRKSEGITRNTVYESVMKRTGGDEAQAQYEARELLNFNRRGASPAIQIINSLVPFQNASWQGADVLYRGLRGHGSNPKMQKQLRNRMATMAGLSAAYTVLASQMPEWQNATPEERDANWFVPTGTGEAAKIKIPFEAGYLAKVIPERMTAMYMGNDTGREFLSAFSRFLQSTMHLGPLDAMPQAIKPALEVATNYSAFRDKPIEPEYMKKKEKGQRFDDNTSELAKKIGEYTDTLSPLQIDHLLRAYTGAVGTYGVQALSLLASPEKAKASLSMAERMPHEIPVVGRLFQREDGGKKLGDYYQNSDKAEQAQNALKAGLEATPERLKLAGIEKASRPIDKQMQLLVKAEKQVRQAMATGNMTPEEARPLLRSYRQKKAELADIVNQMARE